MELNEVGLVIIIELGILIWLLWLLFDKVTERFNVLIGMVFTIGEILEKKEGIEDGEFMENKEGGNE